MGAPALLASLGRVLAGGKEIKVLEILYSVGVVRNC